MRAHPILLSCTLALAGCVGHTIATKATPPPSPYAVEVHAEQPAGFLIVPVAVDGHEAKFIFDTGAGTTVIDTKAFERLGLRRRGRVLTEDSGARSDRLVVTRIGELTIGGATFTKVGAVTADLSFIDHHVCERIDGILGANVMQHGALQVDYATGTVRLASGAEQLPRPRGDALFAKLFPAPLPVVPVQAGDVRFGLIIDTGSNGDIAIDGALLESLGVTERVAALGTTSAGLLGVAGGRDEAFAWPAVKVGQLDLEGADASTAPLPTLGNLILRSFVLRIDYERHVATFWPNARPIPSGHVTFGLGWDYDDRGVARVVFVRERSSAHAAGISEGQTIERVGDATIADLDRDALCRLRRDWSTQRDEVEVVIAGKTHCLRRHSLFAEALPPSSTCEEAPAEDAAPEASEDEDVEDVED